MLNLFAIALMVLSCFLAPADAQKILIDVFNLESGRVQTLTFNRTATGFELLLPEGRGKATITAKGEHQFTIEVPGATEAPHPVDLSAFVKAYDPKQTVQTLSFLEGKVRISRSATLTYLSVVEGPEKSDNVKVHVIRAGAPAAKGFQVPATKLGTKGDFEGWQEYVSPWKVTKAQALAGLKGGHGSPAEAAAHFFASLMRHDDGYLEVVSPNFKPELRKALIAGIKANTAHLERVVGHAKITKAEALRLNRSHLKGLPQKLEGVFGGFDVIMFCEGNTSRSDIMMVFEKVDDQWYVKGVRARFTEFMFEKK